MFDIFSQARVKQILEIDPEELKKENDFDGDTLCIHPIDFTVQRAVNVLKNHNGVKGIITKIIPNSKR